MNAEAAPRPAPLPIAMPGSESNIASAGVILTFESAPQAFYSASVPLSLGDDLDLAETDAMEAILREHDGDTSELVKISVAWSVRPAQLERPGVARLMTHLVRQGAKYYFQPDRRDACEQAIVDRTGVASRTRSFARTA